MTEEHWTGRGRRELSSAGQSFQSDVFNRSLTLPNALVVVVVVVVVCPRRSLGFIRPTRTWWKTSHFFSSLLSWSQIKPQLPKIDHLQERPRWAVDVQATTSAQTLWWDFIEYLCKRRQEKSSTSLLFYLTATLTSVALQFNWITPEYIRPPLGFTKAATTPLQPFIFGHSYYIWCQSTNGRRSSGEIFLCKE